MPKLFSYGTLQQEDVQLATFGRRLSAGDDGDPGSRGRAHEQQDASSDCRFHGHGEDRVPGAPFEISDAELAHADAYEVAAYVCVKAPLASGVEASIYVDARDKSPSA